MLGRGGTEGQFSRSKLQLIFEEIACSLAFPQLCHTLSPIAAFVIARTNWNTCQGRSFWGKMFNNTDIHTHTHYKYTHTWTGRYIHISLSMHVYIHVYIDVLEGSNLETILYHDRTLLCVLQIPLWLESYPESFLFLQQPTIWRKIRKEHTPKISSPCFPQPDLCKSLDMKRKWLKDQRR